jgi:hypothetical protein
LGFDETSGSTVLDSSGFSNDGTLSGATRVSTGKHGKAMRFDGSNDIVTVADSSSLDLTSGMTLEAWVRPTALSTYRPVIVKTRGSSSFSYMLYAHDESKRPSGWIRTTADRTTNSTAALPISTWSHIAATYDGATMRFYVNGVLKRSKAYTGALAVGNGALRIGGAGVWSEWFKGDLDDIRIWNKPLTASQITADMSVDAKGATATASRKHRKVRGKHRKVRARSARR